MYNVASDLLPTIIDSMLPDHSGFLALRFCIELEANYFGDIEIDKELRSLGLRRNVEYIVTRPSNFTKVYRRDFVHEDRHTALWKYVADHDSCWREPFSLGGELCNMRDVFVEAGVPFNKVSLRCAFDFFSGTPHYVTIEKAQAIGPDGPIEGPVRDHQKKRKCEWDLSTKNVPLHKVHPHLSAYRKEQGITKYVEGIEAGRRLVGYPDSQAQPVKA